MSAILSIDFLFRTTPIYDTALDTMTDLVNIECEVNILHDAILTSLVLSGAYS